MKRVIVTIVTSIEALNWGVRLLLHSKFSVKMCFKNVFYCKLALIASVKVCSNYLGWIMFDLRKKKSSDVFLLISVNVSVIVKFTEIGSVEY